MCSVGERKVHSTRASANSSTAANATDKQVKSQKNAHSSGLDGNGSGVCMKPTRSKDEDPFANLALETASFGE